jgi:hypothetical protein
VIGYMAHWCIFVLAEEGEELDPLEAARRAEKMAADPHKSMWGMRNIDTGEVCVVDLTDNRVLSHEEIIEVIDA